MADNEFRSINRILDANANRAREALRVLDDAARFLLDEPGLTRGFKALRHDLVAVIELLPEGALAAARDSAGDVGRTLSVPAELTRRDARDVAERAAGRLTESLRSLEEYGKTIDVDFAQKIESLRYVAYELTGALLARLPARMVAWRVCVLVTQASCRCPWEQVVNGAVAGGADCIQVREKTLSDDALLKRIERTIELARPHGVAVVVNDRVDLALAAGADGVHLGEGDMPVARARALAGGRLLIGASAHTIEQADAALAATADVCGLGTLFPSATKPDLMARGTPLLVGFLERHPEAAHLAIGGIDAARARELADLGCRGVAVSSAVCGAESPEDATRAIVEAMQPAWTTEVATK